jgi:hypothetical protein
MTCGMRPRKFILLPETHLVLVGTHNAVQRSWRKATGHPRNALGRVRVVMPGGRALSLDGRTWEPVEVAR